MTIDAAVAALVQERIDSVAPVGGGDINAAYRVRTERRLLFVKANDQAPPEMFDCERRGLEVLAETGCLRTPEVVARGRADDTELLVLEWIESGRAGGDLGDVLGDGLAALHACQSDRFGFEQANFIGSLPQHNDWRPRWLDFFRDQRLGAQLAIGRRSGRLPAGLLTRGDELLGRLDRWLPDESPVSLLHGDLWGGNYMVDDAGRPVLIDPAVYYGDREIEIAFTQLFGGFPTRFYEAYESVWPLPSGFSERRDLYNLYPLLVHANLFGGSYVGRVDRTIRRYL